jgi:GNAT superfamily N-acetyltransferase
VTFVSPGGTRYNRRLMQPQRSPWDVVLLDPLRPGVAAEIHSVMMEAYRVEAQIIGAEDFVPLQRTVEAVAESPAQFFGIRSAETLVAVAEVEEESPDHVHIDAVVVLPAWFRRGLGMALMRHVTSLHPGRLITVSTGRLNTPAISLYERAGFEPMQSWTTPDGIPMVTLGYGWAGHGPGE